eukprot:jgi/Ulvmu1/1454/UM011_0184.1
MFDDTSQPARHWFYVQDDSIMGPLQPAEMKAWAMRSPTAMSTQVFCVAPDVPDEWARKLEVGGALAATLAEHVDAASNGTAVAPWDLQEVKDSMTEHGFDPEVGKPGKGSGRDGHLSRAPMPPHAGRGRHAHGAPSSPRRGYGGPEGGVRGRSRGGRGARGGRRDGHVDHSGFAHRNGHVEQGMAAGLGMHMGGMGGQVGHAMRPARPMHPGAMHGQHQLESLADELRGLMRADPAYQQGAQGSRGMYGAPAANAAHAHGGRGMYGAPAANAAREHGGHGRVDFSSYLKPADAVPAGPSMGHNPRADAMMNALADLRPDQRLFLHDPRARRQAPRPARPTQHAPAAHSTPAHVVWPNGEPALAFHARPALPDGVPAASGGVLRAPQADAGAAREDVAKRPAQGANAVGGPGGAAVTSEPVDEIGGWPKGGFGNQPTGEIRKTASGTIVFDGPSWGSLVMEDPDAYNP